jgi:hypothetical protein
VIKAGTYVTESHLALGVFYAREAMLDDAEREFEILIYIYRRIGWDCFTP